MLLHAFADELEKIAVAREESDIRNPLLVAATLAPFAGLIGEKAIIHDPMISHSIPRYANTKWLEQIAQPGDIVVMSKRMDGMRILQSATTGSDFTHVKAVVGQRDGRATTVAAGRYNRSKYKSMPREEFLGSIRTLSEDMRAHRYDDAVLLRPTKKLNPKELTAFVDEALDRARSPFDYRKATSSYVKDLFIPKIVSRKALQAQEGIATIRQGTFPDPKTGKSLTGALMCKGDVCSTLAAESYTKATGRAVVPGKKPPAVLPADFLRSKEYRPVGAVITRGKNVSKVLPHLLRGAAGVGLAGGIYAMTERPELVVAGAGAVGAAKAQASLTRYIGKRLGMSAGKVERSIPSLLVAISRTVAARSMSGRVMPVVKYLGASVPTRALGALAALTLARKAFGRGKESKQ